MTRDIVLVLVSFLVCRLPYANCITSECVNTESNYTRGSLFETNLVNLLDQFKLQSSSFKFYNYTIGEAPNIVYGLYQCRNDVGLDNCTTCVDSAIRGIIEECPFYGDAIVWYDKCMLRYASRNIFSLSETYPILRERKSTLIPNYVIFPPRRRIYTTPEEARKNRLIVAVSTSLGVALIALAVWLCCACRENPKKGGNNVLPIAKPMALHDGPPASPMALHDGPPASISLPDDPSTKPMELHDRPAAYEGLGDTEFVQYDFATLKAATENFSDENTLGRGGFGFVYKGTLENGEQLAIKRLSSTSRQGTKEFMAEARFLARLQHTNLVKLLGFCLEGNEKLLVYEFMPNSSLERHLFDPTRRPLLDWITRFNIIMGTTKGLQYLHEDSRLTIIHRDLKPDNILLDEDMNPKIADFGLARLTVVAEKRGTTSRIIGTEGYMAPECLMGEFSHKSDVYSFGVVILEVVSGQNNKIFYRSTKKEDLPNYAWRLWKEGRAIDLADPQLNDNFSKEEVLRCIQIGLLCVQQDEEKRPKMSSIVYMLMGFGNIPLPSELEMSSRRLSVPTIYSGEQRTDTDQYSTNSVTMSANLEQDLYPNPR